MDGCSMPNPIRCWEYLSCGKGDCEAHQADDLRCWLIPRTECFDGSPGLLERLSSRCTGCPVFLGNRVRSAGKRSADQAIIDTMDALFTESAALASEVERIKAESRGKSAQVTLLSEVGKALQSTMEIDELLRVILTAVTAGDGLGFNRAFLLLVDSGGSQVRGRMAVGPSHPSEADTIWKAMESERKSLAEILSAFSPRSRSGADGIVKIAQKLVFDLDRSQNIIARSLDEGVSFVVEDPKDIPGAQEIARVIGNNEFLVAPLVAEGTKLGALLADNFVTKRRIRVEDVRLLETFASQAALAIMNASLHRDLQDRLRQLEEAHEELSKHHLQLLRAERLVTLGGLSASFMHDLKGPLVSVGLAARAAAAKLPEGDAARKSFERIVDEILQIERCLKDLARAAQRGTQETVWIDIAEVLRDSLKLMRGLMMTRGVNTGLSLRHGDASIQGNPVEFRQMIVNLLHNAVEAMPDGGTLTVETRCDKERLTILIKDTGIGIPEEARSRIFSRFFTTKTDGSGLGLFIAKRVITSYGGTMSFESKEGEGTCFSITLPLGEQMSDTGSAKAQ